MKTRLKIYEKGKDSFEKSGIILGNLIMLTWIALGTVAAWLFDPIIGWSYLAFSTIMVFIVLRKLVCTNCYYYDRLCPIGWGKLSALLFKKGDIRNFERCLGLKLAPLTYGLLSIIPLFLITASLVTEFSVFKLAILLVLLLISFYSGSAGRKKACINCRMRLICPGCAVKSVRH